MKEIIVFNDDQGLFRSNPRLEYVTQVIEANHPNLLVGQRRYFLLHNSEGARIYITKEGGENPASCVNYMGWNDAYTEFITKFREIHMFVEGVFENKQMRFNFTGITLPNLKEIVDTHLMEEAYLPLPLGKHETDRRFFITDSLDDFNKKMGDHIKEHFETLNQDYKSFVYPAIKDNVHDI